MRTQGKHCAALCIVFYFLIYVVVHPFSFTFFWTLSRCFIESLMLSEFYFGFILLYAHLSSAWTESPVAKASVALNLHLSGKRNDFLTLCHITSAGVNTGLRHSVLLSVSLSVYSLLHCGMCVCVCVQGTLQKFVDDVFVAILSTKRPPPIAVRFFFDFLDDMAEKHGIDDPETVHIWKTNRYTLQCLYTIKTTRVSEICVWFCEQRWCCACSLQPSVSHRSETN